MKTSIGFSIIGCLFWAGMNHVTAQSVARSSKEVEITTPQKIAQEIPQEIIQDPEPFHGFQGSPLDIYEPPIPLYIDRLIENLQFTEALEEFKKFKTEHNKKERNKVLTVEIMIHQRFSELDYQNRAQHCADRDKIIQQLLVEFPNWTETYQYAITPDFAPEKIIEYCTKSLELDSTNYRVYERRANTYYDMGEIEKACADYEQLSYKNKLWQYTNNCQKKD